MDPNSKAFHVGYAPTGRAKCLTCREEINEGALRFSRRVESPFFEGIQEQHYHPQCFWKSEHGFGLRKTQDLDGYSDLKQHDKDNIQKHLQSESGSEKQGDEEDSGSAKQTKQQHPSSRPAGCPPLQVEHAKSDRSKCRKCLEPINEGELRLAFEHKPDDNQFPGLVPWWHHEKCFFEILPALEKVPQKDITMDWFKGSKDLDKQTLERLEKHLDKIRNAHGKPKGDVGKDKVILDEQAGKISTKVNKGSSGKRSASSRQGGKGQQRSSKDEDGKAMEENMEDDNEDQGDEGGRGRSKAAKTSKSTRGGRTTRGSTKSKAAASSGGSKGKGKTAASARQRRTPTRRSART